MTKKKRLFLDLGMLAICAPLACFLFLSQILPKTQPVAVVRNVLQAPVPAPPEAIPTRPHRINEESFQKIQLGMTKEEVEAIVGVPGSARENGRQNGFAQVGDFTTNKSKDFLIQETQRSFREGEFQWWTCDTFGIAIFYTPGGHVQSKLRIPYVGILPNYLEQEKLAEGGVTRQKPFYLPSLQLSPDLKALPSGDRFIRPLAFSSDESSLVTCEAFGFREHTSRMTVWDTRTGLRRHFLDIPGLVGQSVAYSPDGSCIALDVSVPRRDNELCFWDMNTGKLQEHRYPHKGAQISLAYSPDGKYLAGASIGVQFWDTKTLKEIQLIQPPLEGPVAKVEFSRDGKRFMALSENLIKVYDLEGKKWLADTVFSEPIQLSFGVAMSDDAKTVRTFGGQDGRNWNEWKVPSGTRLQSGYLSFPPCAARFAPDGKTAAWVTLQDKSFEPSRIYISDLESGNTVREIESPFFYDDFVFSPGGNLLAVSSVGDGLRLYNVSEGAYVSTLCKAPQKIADVRFLGTEKLVSLTENGALNDWDLKTFSSSDDRELILPARELLASWNFQGRYLATASRKGSLRLWDTETGKVRWQKDNFLGYLPLPSPLAERNGIRFDTVFDLPGPALLLTGNGVEFSGGGDRSVEIRPERLPRKPITFSSDGSLLACLGKDLRIHVFDAVTGKETKSLETPFPVHCLAMSRNLLACAGPQDKPQIQVFHLARGNPLEPITLPPFLNAPKGKAYSRPESYVSTLQFSPNGQWLAVTEKIETTQNTGRGRYQVLSQQRIHLWKIESENKGTMLPFEAGDEMAFSPDGKQLAFLTRSIEDAGLAGGQIIVWDLTEQQLAQVVEYRNTHITRLAFSPDGRILAGVGSERQVFLWSVLTGKQIIGPDKN